MEPVLKPVRCCMAQSVQVPSLLPCLSCAELLYCPHKDPVGDAWLQLPLQPLRPTPLQGQGKVGTAEMLPLASKQASPVSSFDCEQIKAQPKPSKP